MSDPGGSRGGARSRTLRPSTPSAGVVPVQPIGKDAMAAEYGCTSDTSKGPGFQKMGIELRDARAGSAGDGLGDSAGAESLESFARARVSLARNSRGGGGSDGAAEVPRGLD